MAGATARAPAAGSQDCFSHASYNRSMPSHDDHPRDERAERRERRRQAKRDAVKKHGAKLGEVYRNAILKRLRRQIPKR